MNASPRVTVLMAVYNGERYLDAAIESVLAQTFGEFEFVVIDDCSTDATPRILAYHAARDSRIRVLRNESNLRLPASLNRGLEAARAPLIARIDADDLCLPDRLARQVGFMEANPDHMLVGGGYISIDAEGRERYTRHNPMRWDVAAFTACFQIPMTHPSFCFRARLPDGTPVRYVTDYPYAEDYELVTRLAAAGRIAVLDALAVRYRVHGGTITAQNFNRMHTDAVTLARGMMARAWSPDLCARLDAFLETHHKLRAPEAGVLRQAAPAFDEIVSAAAPEDRRWLRRRVAGMLGEAFLGVPGFVRKGRMALALLAFAPGYVVPLLARLAETRGWIAAGPAPRAA